MAISAEELPPPTLASVARNRPLSQSILAGITGLMDLAICTLTGLALYAVYVAPTVTGKFGLYVTVILAFAFVAAQSLYAAGLYRFGSLIEPVRNAGRQITVYTVLFLLLLSVGFALRISSEFSRVWAFSWLAITVTLSVSSRLIIASKLTRWAQAGLIRRNIVVYGGGEQGERLIRHIEGLNEPWNHVVGVFDDRLARVGPDVAGHSVLGNLTDLIDWARRNRADEVLIALPWSAEERLLAITHCLAVLPTNVRLSPEFVGLNRLHRRMSHQYNVPMLNVMDKPMSSWGSLAKAVMDRVLGVIFLLLTVPLMGIIALAIKLESKGPALFSQQRYGFNHQLILVHKFRTMYTDRTDVDAEHLTLRDDPRVTKVGAVLRRLSLDELPQLFNVLSGEMSVVGPRPHALRAKAGGRLYEDVVDEYATRHKVKPGITGWAQVNGWRGNTTSEDDIIGRVEHDIYYIENWSVMFDLSIILRTFWVVLRGTNSY
ncbi:MAG: undecaprenyl-phosphate glucose phosphotransferase [Gammaproteobacteria bacterium]